MGAVKQEELTRLDEYDRVERTVFRALALYHNAVIERGLMPGVAKRLAVEEAMSEWEHRADPTDSE